MRALDALKCKRKVNRARVRTASERVLCACAYDGDTNKNANVKDAALRERKITQLNSHPNVLMIGDKYMFYGLWERERESVCVLV